MIHEDLAVMEAVHDCPHPDDGQEAFQESSLFVWHDIEAGVGGFWRLGQEVVRGEQNSCFGVFSARDGLRFRSNVTGVPIAAGDRSDTHMGCGPELRVDLDSLRIRSDFADCEVDISFEDFIPRYDWYKLLGRPPHANNHFETSGSMRGHVRIGDREVEIDALAYRDRSWGPRYWHDLRSTRWWPCVFGPDLTIFSLGSVTDSGSACHGYMVKDGVPQTLSDVSTLVTLDWDAISPVSGEGRFTMADGSTATVQHEPTDGIVLHVRGYTAVESVGLARFGDRTGMSNYEVCTNPCGGNRPPVLTLRANSGQGLSRQGTHGGWDHRDNRFIK
jgi:hypothetical protein